MAREGFAYLLAFLLKWKLLEAFIVPTGAMAPTIYGAHAGVVCQNCGMKYAVSMSTVVMHPEFRSAVYADCPNCGQPAEIDDHASILQGDRILVDKISHPRRWDVIVFKFPKDRRINYVKRLVGLPGETVEIVGGGIFIDGRWMQREPFQAQDMWLLVHDSNWRAKHVLPDGPHWEPKASSSRWKLVDGQWTFNGISTTEDALVFCGRLTDELSYCNLSRIPGAESFPAWGCTGHPIHLGKSEYFVLGDNSAASSDSRFWGRVPADDLIGVGRLIYWPSSRWHQFR
jgi:signal peptidase I